MFEINGIVWSIRFIDFNSPILYDYMNHVQSIATTDARMRTIFISNRIHGNLLYKVIKHELYHCYEFSKVAYDLPTYEEEWVAEFISNYGDDIINLAKKIYFKIH